MPLPVCRCNTYRTNTCSFSNYNTLDMTVGDSTIQTLFTHMTFPVVLISWWNSNLYVFFIFLDLSEKLLNDNFYK